MLPILIALIIPVLINTYYILLLIVFVAVSFACFHFTHRNDAGKKGDGKTTS